MPIKLTTALSKLKSQTPPTIEIDPSAKAVYVRFQKTAKIDKTISEDKPGVIVAIDLDRQNRVVGVELLGVDEFTIHVIRQYMPPVAQDIDYERARFVPVSKAVEEQYFEV